MSIELYRIQGSEVFATTESKLASEAIYIIVDKQAGRPRLWVWSGRKAKVRERYIAGVTATKIKSQQQLYGASIEVVQEGSEPESFPTLEADKISEVSEDAAKAPISFEHEPARPPAPSAPEPQVQAEVEVEVEPEPPVATEVEVPPEAEVKPEGAIEPEPPAEAAPAAATQAKAKTEAPPKEKAPTPKHKAPTPTLKAPTRRGVDRLFREKTKNFLKETIREIDQLRTRIEAFLLEFE